MQNQSVGFINVNGRIEQQNTHLLRGIRNVLIVIILALVGFTAFIVSGIDPYEDVAGPPLPMPAAAGSIVELEPAGAMLYPDMASTHVPEASFSTQQYWAMSEAHAAAEVATGVDEPFSTQQYWDQAEVQEHTYYAERYWDMSQANAEAAKVTTKVDEPFSTQQYWDQAEAQEYAYYTDRYWELSK